MEELLDERKRERSGWVWAWQGEQAMNMQFIEALASDDGRSSSIQVPIYAPIVRWWMRPALVANADDLLSRADAFVRAAGAPDDAGAREILRDSEFRSRRNQLSAVLDSSGYSNLNTQFMDLYFRRQAVVALASRMFQLKYGHEPNSVDELVPEFLSEIPRDPLLGSSMKLVAHPSVP